MADDIINDEIEDVLEVPALPQINEGEEDKTDYKEFARQQQEIAEKNRGIAQRNKTRAERFKKLGEQPDGRKETKKSKDNVSKLGELDYAQKAFLAVNDIKNANEIKLVEDIIANTGKTLEEVLESKYFQAELKELRDIETTKQATPPGSKRTGESALDTVEYWIAKGELPPASEVELRRKVVNARIQKEKQGSVFTTQPVVGNK